MKYIIDTEDKTIRVIAKTVKLACLDKLPPWFASYELIIINEREENEKEEGSSAF